LLPQAAESAGSFQFSIFNFQLKTASMAPLSSLGRYQLIGLDHISRFGHIPTSSAEVAEP